MQRADENLKLKSDSIVEAMMIAGILTCLAIPLLIFTSTISAPLCLAVLAVVVIADIATYGYSKGWHHRLFSSGYKPEMSVAMNNLASVAPCEIPPAEWDHPDDVERERCLRQIREADERYGYWA